uniref:Uncharacterized protein n=1 Tax=Arundo donax TaxID=35708 RepID=A0A0A9FXP9_ARUDO
MHLPEISFPAFTRTTTTTKITCHNNVKYLSQHLVIPGHFFSIKCNINSFWTLCSVVGCPSMAIEAQLEQAPHYPKPRTKLLMPKIDPIFHNRAPCRPNQSSTTGV